MAIIKIIAGILLVLGCFIIFPLILVIYVRTKKEGKNEKEKEIIEKAKQWTLKQLWWEYFKPLAAVPFAWCLFHLVIYLAFPNTFRGIWNYYWNWLMAVEICIFVLNSIVNKNTPFEERGSRKWMVLAYVFMFMVIGTRLFSGQVAAYLDNWDRRTYNTIKVLAVERIPKERKRISNDRETKPILDRLTWFCEQAKKRDLTNIEKQEEKELLARAKKINVVPEERKINWRKFWSFGKPAEARAKQVRRLAGVFNLTEVRRIFDQDANGKKLCYKKGDRIQLEQLNSPPEPLTFVNHNIPSWTTRRRICTSGPATEDGKVELMASGKKPITVQVRIIPRRS